jgi:hypothetical protein
MPEIYRIDKRVVLSPNQNWFVSGSVIDDEIYFLTIQNSEFYVETYSKWFLDIYDLNSGNYKESIPIDISTDVIFPFEIRSRKEKLVIAYDYEKIKLYEIIQ